MSAWTVVLPIILGGIATLAIYSFLVKENPFYRFFEHLYIGIATGIGIVFTVQRFLWPELFRPMLGYDREVFADGSYDRPWRSWYLYYLIPFAFGTLYYFIYSRKRQWLSRVVIAWSLGVSGGYALKGFFAQYMPQIIGSFKPLVCVQTVERSLLIDFRDVADRLPPDAEIVKGRIELYRLGPSYARVVVKDKEGKLSEVRGRVTDVNENPKDGFVTLVVNGQEQKIPAADIVLREDVAPAADVRDAYEGHGGKHDYLAYRVLHPWPGQLQAGESPQLPVRLQPDDVAGTAETNTGLALLVREDVTVRDPYRGGRWTVGKRETVGVKTVDLSLETLRTWYDRPEANNGVELRRNGGAGGSFLHRFASSENPDTARRPKLVIEYRVPGEEKPKELVLQNGLGGYTGATEAVIVSGEDKPAPPGPEFLLGASARKADGGLSLDFWSFKGIVADWIFAFTLICVMTYFLFSFEHDKPGIYQASMAGRWLMMLCFGAFFGSTIMARMALLVERLQFLIEKFIPTILGQG